MKAETVSQKELAALLGLSTRQVSNLAEAGMPRVSKSGRVTYKVADCLRWYVGWRVEREASRIEPDDYEKARARKMSAEAEMAELDMSERLGDLITVADAERMLEGPLMRVRNSLQNVPGKYARRFVGLETPAEAQRALDEVVREAMSEMAREEEAADGESSDEEPGDDEEEL